MPKYANSNIHTLDPATWAKQDAIISALWWASTYDILLDDTTTVDILYVWEAAIWTQTSQSWRRIKRINEASWLILWWADWNANFDNIRDDRTSLIYSQ